MVACNQHKDAEMEVHSLHTAKGVVDELIDLYQSMEPHAHREALQLQILEAIHRINIDVAVLAQSIIEHGGDPLSPNTTPTAEAYTTTTPETGPHKEF